MRGRRKKRRKWERARKICSGGSVLAGGNYKNRYEWRGEEWRESGRKGERESEQGCVSVCMVLSPAEADVLYLPGNRRQLLQKPLFHRWNPRLYLQDSYCQFGLFEIEPETEILHTYVHAYTSAIRHASERDTRPPDRRCVHSGYICTPSLQAGAAESGEAFSVIHGWKFVILKCGSNGLSGYWLGCPPLLPLCYVLHPLSEPRQPQTH